MIFHRCPLQGRRPAAFGSILTTVDAVILAWPTCPSGLNDGKCAGGVHGRDGVRPLSPQSYEPRMPSAMRARLVF